MPISAIPLNEVTSSEKGIAIEKLPTDPISAKEKIFLTASTEFRSFVKGLSQFKIEVLTFLYMFAYIIRSVSSMTMIMDKVCSVHLQYSDEVCNNLQSDAYKVQKEEVEKMANNYHLFHTLIQIVPGTVLASFIGPWSDMYGRKQPIIASLIGITIDGLGSTLCAYNLKSRADFYLIPALFSGFGGGFVIVFTVVYSYVTDTTKPESRTFKYALLELSIGLGAPFGSLLGGFLFKWYGYVPVFLTSVAGHLFALVWVIFLLEETRGFDRKHEHWKTKLSNFFCLERLRESIRSAIRPRANNGRMQIWMLFLSMGMMILSMIGSTSIAFLYVFHHYGWDNTKFSIINSVFSVISLFVMLAAVPLLTRKLKVGDPFLGIIGTLSMIIKNFAIALASRERIWLYFAGNFLGMLGGLSSLAGRARISKIVSKDDLGKVFAFLSSLESLVPIAASAIVTQLYNSTIGLQPDPSYSTMGAFLIIALFVYIWLAFQPKVNYEQLQEDTTEVADKPPKSTTEL